MTCGNKTCQNLSEAKSKHLLMVVNEDRFFLSHRLAVALGALSAGWGVTVVAGSTGHDDEICRYGIDFQPIDIDATGASISRESAVVSQLAKIYRRYPDALIHHVGVKMILAGQIALRMTLNRRGGVINAYSGLGRMFASPGSFGAHCILKMLKAFHPGGRCVSIFQNQDDAAVMFKAAVADKWHSELIKGSGVDLEKFHPRFNVGSEYNTENRANTDTEAERRDKKLLRVIFTGRLLRSKGVVELIEAARLLRSKYEGKAEFLICGRPGGGSDGIGEDEMLALTDGNYIKWAGERNDIADLLRESEIMAFPSTYREGVPLSLIEASASGLPIVTCDSVGCRDTVEHGRNGFLVAPHNAAELSERIDLLLSDTSLRLKMGRESRFIAERDYDVRAVVARHLEIYNALYL